MVIGYFLVWISLSPSILQAITVSFTIMFPWPKMCLKESDFHKNLATESNVKVLSLPCKHILFNKSSKHTWVLQNYKCTITVGVRAQKKDS